MACALAARSGGSVGRSRARIGGGGDRRQLWIEALFAGTFVCKLDPGAHRRFHPRRIAPPPVTTMSDGVGDAQHGPTGVSRDRHVDRPVPVRVVVDVKLDEPGGRVETRRPVVAEGVGQRGPTSMAR